MKHKYPLVCLSAWLLVALGPAPSGWSQTTADAAAQALGTVIGKVSDASTGTSLHGASVRVEGTAYETYTDERGEFRLSRIPAGTQRITISYLSYSPASATVSIPAGTEIEQNITLDSETIQMAAYRVTSIAEGEARAINRQRASDTFVTIVSSDAAGNLPDLSIEDVLSRLAGVSISGGGGVTIRGASPDLNSVTLDGEQMASEGSGSRAVPVDGIDADLIASIEVIRALPASMDADGVGGTVNLITRSAFDLRQRILRGRIDYTANTIGSNDVGGSLTFGNVLGQDKRWGVIASLTYQDLNAGAERGEIVYNHTAFDFPVIRQMDVRQTQTQRDRYGFNTTIDYKLSDSTSLTLKAFYTYEEGASTQYRAFFGGMTGWNPATASATFAEGQRANVERRMTDSAWERKYYRASFSGRTQLNRLRLDYEANYDRSAADRHTTTLFGRIPNVNPNVPGRDDRVQFAYDRSDPTFPVLTLVNKNFGPDVDPLFLYDTQIVNRMHFTVTPPNTNYQDGYNARLDLRLPTQVGSLPLNLQAGARFRGKFKKSAPWNKRYDYSTASRFGYILTVADFIDGSFEPKNVAQGRYPTLGAFPNPDRVTEEYLAILASQTPEESIHPTGTGQVRDRLEAANRTNVRRNFTATEHIFASYVQGALDVGKLRLIGGVRVEQTTNDSVGRRYNQSLTLIEPLESKGKYTDLFPSLIGTYRLNANHVLRAGVTNTIARPNYGTLVPFESIPDDELQDDSVVDIGNPDLKSQHSRNLDLSYEWYFQPVGLLTLAAFQKDITKFSYQSIRNEMRMVDIAEEGQPPEIVEVPVRIRTQRNGADARLRGLELSWQHQLTFLPSPWNGFGFNANYTLTEGSSRIPNDLTGELTKLDYLFRQAKDVRNFQVFYEKYGFTARVAHRYNGGWNQNVSDTGNVVVNPTTYWDASVQYNLTRNFTIYLEAKNFTKELVTWYFDTPETPVQWNIPDYGYRGGVKFRF